MTKLSPTQEAILRRMGNGETISWYTKGVRMKTLWVLQDHALIERSESGWWARGVYTITPAGRAYLEGL